MSAKSKLQFLTWLKNRHPEVYESAILKADSSTLGEAQDTSNQNDTPWWQKAVTGVIAAGSTYLNLKAQRDALKMNLQRAEQGLPPVDTSEITQAPTVRTQVDLPPEIITKVTESAGQNVNKMLMVGGGIALLAILVMSKK